MSCLHRYVPSLSIPLLTAGIVALAGGCRDEIPAPTEPGASPSAPGLELAPQPVERKHEERFRKLSQEIPGFAGYYWDGEGNLVALLVDAGEEKKAREALEPIVLARRPGKREKQGGQVLFRKADYPFAELSAYRDRATDAVLNVQGVQYTDLDEARNRFVVAVSSPSAKDEVAKILLQHQVPLEAVAFVEAGPARQLTTLQDFSRPVEGGFQIYNNGGGVCSLGFNASWGSQAVFLTNSHCTHELWWRDYAGIYQNVFGSPNHVGGEAYDPPAPWCAGTSGPRCRYSDAAVIGKLASVPTNFARIARTTFYATGAGISGSITVDPIDPRMAIIGEQSYPNDGDMLDKIGRSTGWTYGTVHSTCVDMNLSPTKRILCQDFIEDMHGTAGDSGAPVFRWEGDEVTLAGLLWGSTTLGGTDYMVMSAMWNIERDLGALTTF